MRPIRWQTSRRLRPSVSMAYEAIAASAATQFSPSLALASPFACDDLYNPPEEVLIEAIELVFARLKLKCLFGNS